MYKLLVTFCATSRIERPVSFPLIVAIALVLVSVFESTSFIAATIVVFSVVVRLERVPILAVIVSARVLSSFIAPTRFVFSVVVRFESVPIWVALACTAALKSAPVVGIIVLVSSFHTHAPLFAFT